MMKMLNGYRWLEHEVGEDTKEIKECLKKGLIKKIDEDTAKFLILEKNIQVVKEILGEDYNKLEEYSIIKWITEYFCGNYQCMKIQNSFGDSVRVSIEQIRDLIKEDEKSYLSDAQKLIIYKAKCPYDEMEKVLNKLARQQAIEQIHDLLNSVSDQTFR